MDSTLYRKRKFTNGSNVSQVVIFTPVIAPGQLKKFEDAELEEALKENSCQTPEKLAQLLGLERTTTSMLEMLVPCCEPGQNIFGNVQVGSSTPPAILI